MSLETESVLDRRRLKRGLVTWRMLAVLAGLLALGAVFLATAPKGLGQSDQIARISIEGMITENRKQLEMLHKIETSDHVKAVLVYVNSPGGTTTGGEAIYEALRKISAKKPVVAQFGTVAASAAYIAGLGTDYIVARGNTITGSVGVIFQWAEVSELLGKLGVKFNEVKSGELKAEPSPFKPLNPGGRRVAEEMVAESMVWFTGLVEERRKIEIASVPGLGKGRVFSGRDALKHKLVDAIGGQAKAVNWLETERKVPADLQIVDWKPKSESDFGILGVNIGLSRLLGRGSIDIDRLLAQAKESGLIRLDGLVSVWQPAKN